MKTPFHRSAILSLALIWHAVSVAAEPQDLPNLGDSTSGVISLYQERIIGQQFLRSLRASAPMLNDPILQDYLEHLVYKLASNSELTDRRLDLVIIKSPSLNAFAAPGGIIGVHHGLFSYGETEHEISAILSHELAHLSQRHFARQLASGKKSGVVSIAGLLAGIVLAATAGTEAGLAAITSSRAYGLQQQLKYSRDREAEADRIGIHTLAEAEMDPRAMAYMFERLEQATRYSSENRIPEFLQTHPVTKSRIADSYNQSQQYPKDVFPLNLDYQLMRVRAHVLTNNSLANTTELYESKLSTNNETLNIANEYGLVLSQTKALKLDGARQHIGQLRDAYPYNIPFRIAEAAIYTAAEQHLEALELLKQALLLSPANYPLSIAYSEAFIAAGNPHAALDILTTISIERPNDEYIWYLMAEAYGLANDIAGVHEARAEFFVLNGNFDQAIKQLTYALPLVRQKFQQTARIKQRLEDIWKLKEGS